MLRAALMPLIDSPSCMHVMMANITIKDPRFWILAGSAVRYAPGQSLIMGGCEAKAPPLSSAG